MTTISKPTYCPTRELWTAKRCTLKEMPKLGGSPGLVIMGRDSRSKGGLNPGTIYWMDIFSHLFVVKICNVCLKRPKIKETRPGLAHFLKKKCRNVLFCSIQRDGIYRTRIVKKSMGPLVSIAYFMIYLIFLFYKGHNILTICTCRWIWVCYC